MSLAGMQRMLYLASRTTGDLNALERGRLSERVVKRYYHRSLIRALRSWGIW